MSAVLAPCVSHAAVDHDRDPADEHTDDKPDNRSQHGAEQALLGEDRERADRGEVLDSL